MSDEEKLVFLHIPKTGGVTIRAFIGQHFWPHEILHIDKPSGDEHLKYVGNAKFIHGHFIYEYMGNFKYPLRKITFLRDPIEQIVSAYRFWKTLNERKYVHDKDALLRIKLAKKFPFDQFVKLKNPIFRGFSNRQTKALTCGKGRPWARTDADRWNRILRRAKQRVDEFDVCGITEMMDQSLQAISAVFGWCPPRTMGRLNETRDAAWPDIDASTREFLLAKNTIDYDVYHYARQRLEKQLRDLDALKLRERFERELCRRHTEDQYHVDMSGPFDGCGFYGREGSDSDWWRWTGPDDTAVIYLRVCATHDRHLRLRLRHVMSSRALNQLRVRIQGHELTTKKRQIESGYLVEGRVPAGILDDQGLVRIELICEHTAVPCEVLAGSADYRRLGVAVKSIELGPIGGS